MNFGSYIILSLLIGCLNPLRAEHRLAIDENGQLIQIPPPPPTAMERFQQIQGAVQGLTSSGGSGRGASENNGIEQAASKIRENINKGYEKFGENLNKLQESTNQNLKAISQVTDNPEVSASINKAIQSLSEGFKNTSTTSGVNPLLEAYDKLGDSVSQNLKLQTELASKLAAAAAAPKDAGPSNAEILLSSPGPKNLSGFESSASGSSSSSFTLPSLSHGTGKNFSPEDRTTSTAPPSNASAAGATSSSSLRGAYNADGL